MWHGKNEILGETSLNMTWIEDFPCLKHNFSICHNLILVVSHDDLNSNLKKFFWTTQSHVVQEYQGMNEFCSNARFSFWVRVVFQWENWVINFPHHQLFRSYLQTNKTVPLIVQHHMSLQKWKFVHCNMRICSVQFCWRLHALRPSWPWTYNKIHGGCQIFFKPCLI